MGGEDPSTILYNFKGKEGRVGGEEPSTILYNSPPFFKQFGNTCYINSVLQALYFCKPFREKILEYKAKNKRTKETLLACLADLFYSIATQKKKVGSIAPKKFIARFRKENGKWYSV